MSENMSNKQKNIWEKDKTVLKDVIPLEMPFCICIEPSNICNFKCAMCFHGNNESDPNAAPLKNMDMSVFEKALADIKDWVEHTGKKVKLIKLYSLGEPLLHPNICDMVKEIKAADICDKIEITTNGSLLTKEISEKLVDFGLDVLRVSVYSIYEDRMKEVTASNVRPQAVFDNLAAFREYRDLKGGKTLICAKMLSSNNSEDAAFIEQYNKIADEVGIDEVFATNLGEGNDAFANMYGENADEVHRQSLNSCSVNTDERRPCRYPFTHMTIRNDGTVITCCSDWIKELKYGNVKDNSLMELWQSKSLYDIRMDMLKTKGQKWETCRCCEIPFRDSPEDDISGIEIDRLDYKIDI